MCMNNIPMIFRNLKYMRLEYFSAVMGNYNWSDLVFSFQIISPKCFFKFAFKIFSSYTLKIQSYTYLMSFQEFIEAFPPPPPFPFPSIPIHKQDPEPQEERNNLVSYAPCAYTWGSGKIFFHSLQPAIIEEGLNYHVWRREGEVRLCQSLCHK